MSIKFKKLSTRAFQPTWGSTGAVGLDLKSAYGYSIEPNGVGRIETDLTLLEMPPNCYGRIAPRSGLALYQQISVGAGVVDPDYRGDISIVLFNHSKDKAFDINPGDKVAQFICEQAFIPEVVYVTTGNEVKVMLKYKECGRLRGVSGFGSSGTQ